jgi:hypothetical protein
MQVNARQGCSAAKNEPRYAAEESVSVAMADVENAGDSAAS